jgi:hypothetical protein
MWDDAKYKRFSQLRDREWKGALTAEEKAELAAMTQELYDMEAAYLQPATERLEQETAQLRAELERVARHNQRLDALIRRKESLLAKVNAFIAEAEAEQEELQREYQAIRGEPALEEEVEVSR